MKGKFEAVNIDWAGDGEPLADYQAKIVGKSLKGKCDNDVFTIDLVEKRWSSKLTFPSARRASS